MDNDKITIATRYGEFAIARQQIEPVLGTRVCRVARIVPGFYDKPFLVYHQEQGLYHRFRNPYDALRQTVFARGWEGTEIGQNDIPDGERRRMLAVLARHGYLKLLLTADYVTDNAFTEACASLANDLGQPRNRVKQDVLQLTLLAATTEDSQAATALDEAMVLDQERLRQVDDIGEHLDWRAAAIACTIIEQQELMADLHLNLEDLLVKHGQAHDQYNRRLQRILADALTTRLDQARDRPFRNLAGNDQKDLQTYCSMLANGRVAQAGLPLKRAVVAHRCFSYARELQVVLYRLALASGHRGPRQREIHDRTCLQLTKLRDTVDVRDGATLRNNPLGRAKHLMSDALVVWHSPNRDWTEIKELLKQAIAAFGG